MACRGSGVVGGCRMDREKKHSSPIMCFCITPEDNDGAGADGRPWTFVHLFPLFSYVFIFTDLSFPRCR